MGRFIRTTTRNCEGGIAMHDQSKITRRRGMQMAGAVAGLAAAGARGAWAQAQPQMQPRIERLAPELDKIISVDEPIKDLASGFGGPLGPAEGPLWWKEGGYLLFTDIHNNRRMKYTPGKGVTVDLEPTNRANGLTRDLQGRLLSCEHDSARDAARARRRSHGSGEQLSGAAAQPPKRCGGEIRRRDLFHRSLDLADAARAMGPDLCRRLPAHPGSRHVHAARRQFRVAQRACVLARRERALH